MMTLKPLIRIGLMAASAALAFTVNAQEFPTKTVSIFTPFPAGSGPEAVMRLVAERLQRKWGKPVIIENRPGANGFIAIDAFKRAPADGHSLIQLENAHLVTYPLLFKKLPYEPAKDFDLIAPLFKSYFFVAVGQNSKYKTVDQIVADAHARKGVLNYGSWSVGNSVHLGSAMLETMTDTNMQHIIYKEATQLVTAVANGELDWALSSLATAGPMQRSGKIKFLAVTAPKRLPTSPDIPAVAESGRLAGYEVAAWSILAAAKGLPKPVADKIRKDVEEALADPEIKTRYANFGYEPFQVTQEQFGAFTAAESKKYGDIINRTKASLD